MHPRTRAAAVVLVVLLIVVAGAALLSAMRSQVPETVGSGGPSPTPTLPVATATATTTATTSAATPPGNTNPPTASVVSCGTLAPNSVTSGQGSGPNTYELLSPTGVTIGRVFWASGQASLGTYVCARFIPGAPVAAFDSLIRPGDPDYIAQPTVATDSCGSVTAYASDGAVMLVTLAAGGTATQYYLESRFSGGGAPRYSVLVIWYSADHRPSGRAEPGFAGRHTPPAVQRRAGRRVHADRQREPAADRLCAPAGLCVREPAGRRDRPDHMALRVRRRVSRRARDAHVSAHPAGLDAVRGGDRDRDLGKGHGAARDRGGRGRARRIPHAHAARAPGRRLLSVRAR